MDRIASLIIAVLLVIAASLVMHTTRRKENWRNGEVKELVMPRRKSSSI